MSGRVATHPAVLRHLRVMRVRDLGPRMRRITLGGPELAAFERDDQVLPAFRTVAPDDHVRVIFPAPGSGSEDVPLPTQAGDRLEWSGGDWIPFRYYTVRRFAEGELDIDIVLHGDGRASRWASQAEPGMSLHVAGPRTSVHAPASTALLLVGDETALPAIARWAEEATPGTSVTAIVEVHDADDEQELGRSTGVVDVTWAHRSAGERALDVVRRLPPPEGDVFAFVAGELSMVTGIRRHLCDSGLAAQRCRSACYWRADAGPVDDRNAIDRVEDLADLLTPHAVRVAATLRLPDHVAAGATTAAALAARAGTDPVATAALVSYLADEAIFAVDDDGAIALGSLGRVLLDDDPSGLRGRLDLGRAEGHMASAWAGLLHTTRSGDAGYEQLHGVRFWDRLARDERLAGSFDEYLDRWASEWVRLAVGAHDWSPYRSIVDVGGGGGRLLAALLGASPHSHGVLVELAATARRATERFDREGLSDRVAVVPGSFFDPLPPGDAVVLAQVLHDWPDAAAAAILRRAAAAIASGGRLLVIERLSDHGPHPAMTLLMRNLFGACERSQRELVTLASSVGLRHVQTTALDQTLHLLQFAPAQAGSSVVEASAGHGRAA